MYRESALLQMEKLELAQVRGNGQYTRAQLYGRRHY